MPDFKSEQKDQYGLPRISIDGGKPETTDRAATRAPILIGGTVTGKQFQTDAVDPRITIDSTSLICHNTAGQSTLTINIANGNVDLLYGSGISALLRWVDTSGAVQAQISYSATTTGLLLETIGSINLFSSSAIGSLTPAANIRTIYSATVPTSLMEADFAASKFCTLSVSSETAQSTLSLTASDGTRSIGILLRSAAATTNYIQIADTTSRLRIGYDSAASTNSVDYINGNLVFQTADKYTGNIAGQTVICGVRCLSTLANAAYGGDINWRHVRTDTAGALVTPGSITLGGAPSLNTNAASPQVRSLSSRGGSFTISPVATGIGDYLNAVTVN